jgi:hypothetical protein
MSVNFSNLLSTAVDKIEKPMPLPAGTYDVIITKYEFDETKNEKKTPYCKVFFKVLSAGEDVDAEELAKIANLSDKVLSFSYYLTPDALWRFKEFLVDILGLTDGDTLEALIPGVVGQSAKASVEHTLSRDGTETYAQVNRILKA